MNNIPPYINCLLVVLAMAGCGNSKKQGPPPTPPPPAVTVFIVSTQDLGQNITLSGTLQAEEEVVLKPEISAKIVSINFQEGGEVKKGQLLVKLFDADIRAQLNKLQMQQKLASKTLERQEQLLKINGISQQEYDLSALELNKIEADISLLRAQLSKTEIRAPFSGKMGLKSVSEGAYVPAGLQLATLQQTNTLKLDFSVPEKYGQLMKPGDPVSFTVEGRKGSFTAKIFATESFVSPESRTLRVRARFENKENLLPGTFAKVDLQLQDIPEALIIPTQAIIPEARHKKVILVKNGEAVFSTVETGLRTASGIQIESGIAVGDTLVITGLMQIKPGSKVKINKVVKELPRQST